MLKHLLLAGACLALNAVGADAAEAPAAKSAPLPVKAFFAPPQFSGAMLSPDGKNLALLLRGPEGHIVLANMPAAGGPVRILAGVKEMDVFDIHWVNNHRLVFSAHRTDADEHERARGPGLHAIDIDGSKHVHLVAHQWGASTQSASLPPNTFFLSTVRDAQSSDVYVTRQSILN